jgi:hypothetical protein
MSFAELVAAALLLLSPDLAHEASLAQIKQADTTSPYAGFFDMQHPEYVWVNTEYAYNAQAIQRVLAHELTHRRDWRSGALTLATCGEDYVQAEYRAMQAEREWGPGLLLYIRAQPQYQKPC